MASWDAVSRRLKTRTGKRGKIVTGKNLEKVNNPDETIEHKIACCERCNEDLSFHETEGYETRQVFDVEIKKVVIEHRAEIKKFT